VPRISVKGAPCLAGVGTAKIVGTATWRPTQPSDGAVRIAAKNFGTPSYAPHDCSGASLESLLSTQSNTTRERKWRHEAPNKIEVEAKASRQEITVVDKKRSEGAGEARAELSGSKSKGARMTTTEDLEAVVLRAQRVGFTVAFVNVDCVVGGKTPDYLLVPPQIADQVQAQFPAATRLSLSKFKTYFENKMKAKEKASAQET